MSSQTQVTPDYCLSYCERLPFLDGAHIERMGLDCSIKVHYRVTNYLGNTYVLMDASKDPKVAKDLVSAHNFINNNGLSAPKVIDCDLQQGLVLTEDFGFNSYNRILQKHPEQEEYLYLLATKVLLKLHTVECHSQFQAHNVKLLVTSLLHAFRRCHSEHSSAAEDLSVIFEHLCKPLKHYKRLVFRDYHADNIMLLEDRDDVQKVGLIDIQDLSIGHSVYDLVSLLEDARRDIMPSTVSLCKLHFAKYNTQIDQDEFDYAYNILGMQRSLRVMWLFMSLQKIPGKEHYGVFLPRVSRYIQARIPYSIYKDLDLWAKKYKIPLYV